MRARKPVSNSQQAHAQAGVTLVELLIAMGLSVFLMAAVVQSFLGSRQSSNIVQAQARMQENARFAFLFMTRSVRMAGYPSELIPPDGLPDISLVDNTWRSAKMPENLDFASFEEQAVVWGENGGSGVVAAKADSDAVHVRLQGMADGSVTDCQGRPIDADVWAQFSFFIDAQNDFRCRSDDGTSVQNAVLVQGIEEMQVMYGLNPGVSAAAGDEFDSAQVSRWVNADDVGAGEWRFVSSVKVALVSASDTEPLSAAGPGISYDLLDYTSPEYVDGRARQQFAQTIRLRNQNWNASL